jgi:hypothetical protein
MANPSSPRSSAAALARVLGDLDPELGEKGAIESDGRHSTAQAPTLKGRGLFRGARASAKPSERRAMKTLFRSMGKRSLCTPTAIKLTQVPANCRTSGAGRPKAQGRTRTAGQRGATRAAASGATGTPPKRDAPENQMKAVAAVIGP